MKSSIKVGNWLEENALKELGGHLLDPTDKSTSVLTRYRVVEHKDQIDARNYKSTIQGTFEHPQAHQEFVGKDKRGPKARLHDSILRKQVADEFKEKMLQDEIKSNERNFNTTYSDATGSQNCNSTLRTYRRGEAVPRPKPLGSRVDPAITYYYHTALKTRNVPFKTSTISSISNPWAKGSGTSGDINNGVNRNQETFENPGVTPTLQDFPILKAFRDRILGACAKRSGSRMPGLTIRVLSQSIHELDPSPQGRAPVDRVVELLVDSLGEELSIDEINSLIRSFSRNNSDEIILIELIEFLRGKLPEWRLEFTNQAFASISKSQSSIVTESELISSFNSAAVSRLFGGQDLPDETVGYLLDSFYVYNPLGVQQGYSKVDFLEYYRDVSAEVVDEDLFEKIVTKSWGVHWK